MEEIKKQAREVIKKYNPEGLVPFPFEPTIKELGDIELRFLPITDDVSGAILRQGERFTILINDKKAQVRQYFTIAHELGHYFLHREWLKTNAAGGVVDFAEMLDGQGMLLRPDEPSLTNVDLQKEREANNFAAELLMPEDKVRDFWALTHDIADVANAFQVSKSAMAIRLERLRLLS